MDHPWRFPAGADLCPVCSARHFPFCPPPPLPPHPFPYELHPPPPPPHPYPYDLHPPPPPPMWGPPAPGPHDPHPYELHGREGPHKRMRVGEAPPFDPYEFAPPPPPGRVSVEGDRLLGLIRDHGRNPLPGSAWRGEPCPPDGGFGYGGGRGYPLPPPYPQGGDFVNFDHAGKLPPPMPIHDWNNGFGQGFAPGEGPHEMYPDSGDRHYHQFHLEAVPGAAPLPSLPLYAEAANPNGSRAWLTEAGAVPPPPEPPFPSHRDYCAAPPCPTPNSSLFPVPSGSPATACIPPSAHTLPQAHLMPNANSYDGHINDEGSGLIYQSLSQQHLIDGRSTSTQHSVESSKVTIIDACDLFKQPLRSSRPDHIVIILRGLPGSGKSYLAKALRDLEVENGASVPRIHSMDDYFMIEVEKKVEDNESSKSSSASKGRRQLTKKVIEYCYEPEMEETYRSSMLKAFKKTLDEGNFTFVIVDDRNLRVADFAQFWATAKHSGYEVYLLEAPYKDPTGCAARNVHGFTLEEIKNMAADWEEAPPLYLQLDIHSLFHDDNLRGHTIQEVDMDTEDDDANETASTIAVENSQRALQEASHNESYEGFSKQGEKWNSEVEDDLDTFKELGQSKWSKDFEDDTKKSGNKEENTHALSGLPKTYSTRQKRVTWGDRLEKGGFSIAATKRKLASSLVIGPGSGYNLVSNPLAEDNSTGTKGKTNNETKKRFSEQLRDEGQSFRAVFDKRKQRIGVFENGDDV